jgi:surfeit locus 1 family protein
VLTVGTVWLFTRLGLWQLHRAHEKEQMLSASQAFAKQSPMVWQGTRVLPTQYQQIKVQGRFLSKIFLYDNQHHQHQFGYHVISPLYLGHDQVVLIDRGWVLGDISRRTFPVVKIPVGVSNIVGCVYYPSEKNWILGPIIEQKQKDLAVVEQVDTQLISQILHKSVYPFIIRLGPEEANGYVREWSIVSMPPLRHYAYALQWFAMAAVVLILFVSLNIKYRVKGPE